jgi:hypothetical protein
MTTTPTRRLSDTEQRVRDDLNDLRHRWRARDKRIEEIYDLRRLVDLWRKGRKTSYVSNDPLTYFNVSRHMLSSRQFKVRALMARETHEDRHEIGITERAVTSIFREFDDRQLRIQRLPWRQELADQILMGWANIFYGVFKGEDGRPIFRSDIWDNLTVYHDTDDDGLATVIHHYAVTPSTAQQKARERGVALVEGQDVRRGPASVMVTDWYHREAGFVWHALTIGDQEIIPAEQMEEMDEIPVLIVPVNGESRRSSSKITEDPVKWMFASILHPIERTVKDQNDWLSMVKDIGFRNAQKNYVTRTEDAQGIEGLEEAMRRGDSAINLRLEESVDPIGAVPMLTEVSFLTHKMEGDRQRGSIPNTFFADVAADTSGFLFSQLQAASLTNMGPYDFAYSFILRTLSQAYVEGFRDGGFSPITVKGRYKDDGNMEGYFFDEWKPSDVPNQVWIEVLTQLAIPRNRVQEISAMRQANAGTPNLIDMTTLLDEVGGFDDPTIILERIREDNFRNSPANQMTEQVIEAQRMSEYYRAVGDEVAAEAYEETATKLRGGFFGTDGQGGPPQARPGVPPETAGVRRRNGQTPSEERAALAIPTPQPGGR